MREDSFATPPTSNPTPSFVCKACGAALEVVVNFAGKIVWPVNPESPDFGSEQPSLRGESKNVRVACTADVMHSCGYTCVDGVLVESDRRR